MRTDAHRPAVIDPADYEYVSQEFFKIESFGDAAIILAARALINAHMAKTGGRYSGHEHGGNCMVCGSVNAVYTTLFYHAKTNSYVRMGTDCTDRVFGQDFGAGEFRRGVRNAIEALDGKKKAQALLAEAGLSDCWPIYSLDLLEGYKQEELTIRDIVGKLVRYGSISEKQTLFLGSLLNRITSRSEREARFAAEKEAAKPVPTGRIEVTGTILSLKVVGTDFGLVTKMTVKSSDGWVVYGTRPMALGACERGQQVTFTATVEASKNDPKFGFFKRPTAKA